MDTSIGSVSRSFASSRKTLVFSLQNPRATHSFREELRNNIISAVKQSTALNRAGAENMKPRQLSDAIHEEIKFKVMSQISDGLWEIIRSKEGMKSEIEETVQSVYDKLVNPGGLRVGESSTHDMLDQKEPHDNCPIEPLACTVVETLPDREPKAPPGFCQNHYHNDQEKQLQDAQQLPMPYDTDQVELQKEGIHHSKDVLQPPGFSIDVEHKQLCDCSDEDPDVPPGFG
ncbi:uncharacterized protein LOC123203997 isoform X2 [Mangifera indica]|uniref:uncharacterized protein LOC123203997 isoform X2 n=1 Tax=Mangifera indica TaxID=29780 RepID=UPI001CFBC91B|nr:uncharacterized protein LOC123203997 isoform X2 [Mangifera indica]